jgi:3-oxoacyl-[acyl-carrier-protein] synthase-3
MGLKITSTGSRLGSVRIDNDEIQKICGVPQEEILRKTGIVARQYLDYPRETLLDLSVSATEKALEHNSTEVWDLVVCATFAHEMIYPSLASRICSQLPITVNEAVDLQSNCTGFLNALLITNDKLLTDQNAQSAIVIAAEANSYFMNPSDANSVMFWGDGAAALTIHKDDSYRGGLLSRAHFANFESNSAVRLSWSKSQKQGEMQSSPIHQDGLATWRQATSGLPKVIYTALDNAGLDASDIDYFIFHQANLRMIEYLTVKLKLDPEKVPTNVERIGNTGAASIPILLDDLIRENKVQPGDRILFASVGAGFTFTAVVWEW